MEEKTSLIFTHLFLPILIDYWISQITNCTLCVLDRLYISSNFTLPTPQFFIISKYLGVNVYFLNFFT